MDSFGAALLKDNFCDGIWLAHPPKVSHSQGGQIGHLQGSSAARSKELSTGHIRSWLVAFRDCAVCNGLGQQLTGH